MKRRTRESQSSVVPLLRENVCLLKECSVAQLDCVTRSMVTGLDSPGDRHHFSEAAYLLAYCSDSQEEIRGRRLAGLIEEQR
jgi:hypothetical protein